MRRRSYKHICGGWRTYERTYFNVSSIRESRGAGSGSTEAGRRRKCKRQGLTPQTLFFQVFFFRKKKAPLAPGMLLPTSPVQAGPAIAPWLGAQLARSLGQYRKTPSERRAQGSVLARGLLVTWERQDLALLQIANALRDWHLHPDLEVLGCLQIGAVHLDISDEHPIDLHVRLG